MSTESDQGPVKGVTAFSVETAEGTFNVTRTADGRFLCPLDDCQASLDVADYEIDDDKRMLRHLASVHGLYRTERHKTCVNCEEEFRTNDNDQDNRFCSSSCFGEYQADHLDRRSCKRCNATYVVDEGDAGIATNHADPYCSIYCERGGSHEPE